MTDHPDPPRDDLDDDITVGGDDEILEVIRRHAAERASGHPAPSDDLDDDVTIADPGVLDELRQQSNVEPPSPGAPPPADLSVPWSSSTPRVPDPASDMSSERPQDVLDDPTVGAPEGHPSRPEHPILGSPPPVPRPSTSSQVPPAPLPPVPGPRLDTPPGPAVSSAPDPSLSGVPSGRDDDAWTPPANTRRSGITGAASPKPDAPRRTSLPVWVIPAAAALLVTLLLVQILR